MPASARPRRSVLYMPGSNPRALEKGRTLSADVLILDLEDAVAPDAKAAARTNIAAALAEGVYGKREILVRVTALDAPWGPADLAIWCMIETPMGVLHAEEIAAASPRMAGFVMGTSDLAKELHCLHTPQRLPFMTSLNHVVLVARAYGLAALDGVHLDLSDDQGFTESCQQGLELGFDGKTLIHPKTIDQANQTFGPNAQEVESSKEIIAAFEEAQSAGKGVVVLNGKLVENLHVENARRILTLAQMIEDLSTEKE